MKRNEAAHSDTSNVYNLTEQEKIWLGLIKSPIRRGNIRIAYPVHYSAASVVWKTTYTSDIMLPKWRVKYPNLQVLEVRRLR